jgi:hypothetical protein
MIRIDALRYYTDSAHRDAAIAELAALKCAFLVFGREADGHFIQLRDLDLSSTLRDICTEVPLGDFREDISSTALRQRDGT